ncbi:winged helix-turn-helix transcriptional regulator [Cupriavidus consociatus]|uniref:winged helix-turn-helix transcriptional regulator n=1 Tax=Cupriavidus consociatus TaxID=2821357 RepID=UPI001AE8D2A0|nr:MULTISPECIES: helix-turn-helix domain-containing protein [unclassified Cupriavidus]MBP0623770.1 helix-turn-helix transcriptional regulator [Cupriavidus sp. LEh25]MDK2660476.1 helix-turn-helix domain-containing protein [Cupriavidus sp. LEh21]
MEQAKPGKPGESEHKSGDRKFASTERYSSVARTVEILSDAWGFLVLRECFFGVRRFEQFQSLLQVPRTTLVQRLTKLTELGILRKVPVGGRHEYRFTDKGRDLYPTMLSLLAFGDKWLAGGEPPPLQLFHTTCGSACSPRIACSHCNDDIDARRVRYRDGPGAGVEVRTEARKRSRRTSDPGVLQRVRPCSVARTLQIIGDRWSFLVIREFFYGVRRFDEFQSRLGIATNILADRLQRLTEEGVINKRQYQERPARFEYMMTEMGLDLYGSMLVMMHWGDKWLSGGKPPLTLRHSKCDHDFHAVAVCNHCGKELDPRDVSYSLRYDLEGAAQAAA